MKRKKDKYREKKIDREKEMQLKRKNINRQKKYR